MSFGSGDINISFEIVRNYIKMIIDSNNNTIKNNSNDINNILKMNNDDNRQELLDDKLNKNKALLADNYKLLILYNNINNFMNEYFNKKTLSLPSNSETDYFELTITKVVDFDEKHPFFNDDDFYNKLLNYFIEHEDYEYCAYLKSLK